jgi:MFS family permease
MNQNDLKKASSQTKPAFFYGYVIAISAFCILFAVFGIRMAYGVFFKPMSAELGWSHAMTALAFSISVLMEGLFNLILGGVADKYGPRLVITLSGILIGIGYCLMPLVHSTWQFYLFYGFIIGLGMGGMYVPLVTLIARWFKARRTLMTGVVVCGASIGMFVVSPLAAQMIEHFSWRTTFLIVGIFIILVVSIGAQFLRRDPSALGLKAYGDETETGPVKNMAAGQGMTFQEALKTPQLWLVFAMLFCYGFYQSALSIHLVPDAINSGITPTTAAYILSIMGGASIAGRLGLGALGDKLGNRFVYILGFSIFTIVIFWIINVNSIAAFFGFAAIFGIAQGGVATSQSPIIASLFGLRSHGLLFGLCGFGCTIGMALGPYVAGFLYDQTNSYRTALLYCVALSATGLILAILIKPVKKRHRGQSPDGPI